MQFLVSEVPLYRSPPPAPPLSEFPKLPFDTGLKLVANWKVVVIGALHGPARNRAEGSGGSVDYFLMVWPGVPRLTRPFPRPDRPLPPPPFWPIVVLFGVLVLCFKHTSSLHLLQIPISNYELNYG